MRGLQKRVSWASDVNLNQVKLFLLEESPSQVGLSAQDHLQAKTSWLSHSSGTGSDENLPPGFESAHPVNQLQIDLSQIPLIRWKSPPRVVLNLAWQVVAGEESKEVQSENQRELRVLEAVYPRQSAIPPNPFVDVEESIPNDVQPLSIPITPVEEEDAAVDTSSELMAPFKISTSSPSFLPTHGIPPQSHSNAASNGNLIASSKPTVGTPVGVEPNVVAAALGAIMNGNNDHGNMIDPELLIKILSNPKMIEKLVTDPQAVARSPSMTTSDSIPLHISKTESITPLSTTSSSAHFYPQATMGGMGHLSDQSSRSTMPVSSSPAVGPPPAKDINYYKSLIQQHGGDTHDSFPPFGSRQGNHSANHEPFSGYKSRDSKPKIMKPCIYFNSSRGCRHGANCSFQHDASFQQQGNRVPDVQNAKRMKLDREISS
ncbi:zinc finger CCCH domain-containing protein 6 [Argentina anserina]|uniref:zinc finger CCCH domain-containing protein 6 n=1 Tax=Argentina anserina TaxID=57926 RepID=UPI002176554F|nr:zinc finger CCCH domain-containing protein 6 [Potentilla anserina]